MQINYIIPFLNFYLTIQSIKIQFIEKNIINLWLDESVNKKYIKILVSLCQ